MSKRGRLEAGIVVPPGGWSVSFADSEGTGLVTIEPGTWSISWTADQLRAVLGFEPKSRKAKKQVCPDCFHWAAAMLLAGFAVGAITMYLVRSGK